MEVVQQIGSDSFDPGHGVLISKTKNGSVAPAARYSCFVWVVDSHPEDINQVDFVDARRHGRTWPPSATSARRTTRRSTPASNSGSSYEYEDAANRLHFYIIDKHTDAAGHPALHGRRALARRRRPADARRRRSPRRQLGNDEGYTTCTFNLKNTGAAAAVPAGTHPQDASAYLGSDIYRLSTTATGTGWSAYLKNALATAKFGDSVSVPVYIEKGTGSGTVTLNGRLRERPDQDRLRRLHAGRLRPSAAPSRPRSR